MNRYIYIGIDTSGLLQLNQTSLAQLAVYLCDNISHNTHARLVGCKSGYVRHSSLAVKQSTSLDETKCSTREPK
jgi:hypothetical protein